MAQKANIGDIFLIPIDGTRRGVGQIAGDWKGELYIVIYEGVYDTENIAIEEVVSATPLFAALSLDAKINNGDWKVIGNHKENITKIPQPVFKVSQGSEIFIETRDRSITRLAKGEEVGMLRHRTVVAPVRLEKALKACNGVGDWNEKYDDLRYDYAVKSSAYGVA